jgi:toxin YoeB
MRLLFSTTAWDEYQFWIEHDRNLLDKLNRLIKDVQRTPFKGLGKPEPLRGSMQGWWSRRITGEHRLVYRVEGAGDEQRLVIVQCRFHH